MRRYAVVGGMGAGKSTVCRMLARHGGSVIDVDHLGHRVLLLPQVRRELSERFGAAMLGPDGAVNRRALGRRVFRDPAALRDLNALVHPEIGRLLRRRVAVLEHRGVPVVWIDAALFLDIDLGVPVDAVIAVTAPKALRRQRLLQRGGLGLAEIDTRLDSQRRLGVWTRCADYRIDTRGTLQDLQRRVDGLWQRLQTQPRRKRGGKGWRTRSRPGSSRKD